MYNVLLNEPKSDAQTSKHGEAMEKHMREEAFVRLCMIKMKIQ